MPAGFRVTHGWPMMASCAPAQPTHANTLSIQAQPHHRSAPERPGTATRAWSVNHVQPHSAPKQPPPAAAKTADPPTTCRPPLQYPWRDATTTGNTRHHAVPAPSCVPGASAHSQAGAVSLQTLGEDLKNMFRVMCATLQLARSTLLKFYVTVPLGHCSDIFHSSHISVSVERGFLTL